MQTGNSLKTGVHLVSYIALYFLLKTLHSLIKAKFYKIQFLNVGTFIDFRCTSYTSDITRSRTCTF